VWRDLAAARLHSGPSGGRPRVRLVPDGPGIPTSLTDGVSPTYQSWQPSERPDAIDRAIAATRHAVFPLLGLDPDDPRD
jgi:acetoin utilization protein AcuC